MSIEESIVTEYGNRLRVRVCGFLQQDACLLLMNHRNLGVSDFWIPPGGGMEFGESASEALIREFQEETGLEVRVKRFLCVHEFLAPPLHGVELFFEVEKIGGILQMGQDPEMKAEQLFQQLTFVPYDALKGMRPEQLHPVVRLAAATGSLEKLSGYAINGVSVG